MNSERSSPSEHPRLEKRAEAAAWLARLHGPQRSAQMEQGLQRWLRADVEHARAFELLTERLEMAERLRGRRLPRRWSRQGWVNRSGWRPIIIGIAAALTMMTVGTFLYTRNTGVVTQVGEQRLLTLSDGSRVYLNTDTHVVVSFDNSRRTVELKSGEALFEVAANVRLPFIVVAGKRRVEALGTTFVVRRDSEKTAVTLIEGKVAVSDSYPNRSSSVGERGSADDGRNGELAQVSILSPGERVIFVANKPALKDQPPLDKVTAWRQGQVALEDMPLSEATVEMNRYSALKLVVEHPEAATVRVGGFFRMGDSASFARAVASTYGLEVIERSDEIVITGEPKR